MSLVKYFFVGGMSALVDWTIFAIFAYLLGMNYLIISACGFIIATFVNYYLSVLFVFKSGIRFGRKTEIITVFVVSAIGLTLHQLVLYALVDLVGWDKLLSKILASGSIFAWNYSCRRYFVFAARSV